MPYIPTRQLPVQVFGTHHCPQGSEGQNAQPCEAPSPCSCVQAAASMRAHQVHLHYGERSADCHKYHRQNCHEPEAHISRKAEATGHNPPPYRPDDGSCPAEYATYCTNFSQPGQRDLHDPGAAVSGLSTNMDGRVGHAASAAHEERKFSRNAITSSSLPPADTRGNQPAADPYGYVRRSMVRWVPTYAGLSHQWDGYSTHPVNHRPVWWHSNDAEPSLVFLTRCSSS